MGDEAYRKKMGRKSRIGLVLAYRKGSLGIVYLWLMRKETGTNRREEDRGCGMVR